jgi:hypothetical protein
MGLKAEAIEKGFDHLDTHECGEGIIIAGLAAITSPKDIAKGFKDAHYRIP